MSIQDRLDELNLVEQPLLEQLSAMGWTVAEGADEDASSGRKEYHALGRADFTETLLRDRLAAAVRQINPAEPIDEPDLAALYAALERPQATDFIAINEELHGHLTRGLYLPHPEGGRDRHVRLIDFDHPEANDLLAVSQFRVDPRGSRADRGYIVPDVALFVNGIPLVVIECKSPSVSEPRGTAIDQLRRYANRRVPEEQEGAERLFWTNLLLIATCYLHAHMGSVTARPEDFLPWRDPSPVPLSQVAAELGRGPTDKLYPQDVLTAGALRPAHLLQILQSFTVFMTTDSGQRVKAVPRYQQFRAVHAALDRLATGETRLTSGTLEDRRGGVIWHTQGSGKSLTMVFLVKRLRALERFRPFKVVVVTDRIDLEDQLSSTAKLSGGVVRVADSSAKARAYLSQQQPDMVFVMLQKVQDRDQPAGTELRIGGVTEVIEREPAKFPVLNESADILILVDEAHRSHTSTLHQNLLEALPNAARIGFTGTPIEEKGKKLTRAIFGDFIDRYRLKEAEEDGAIVKILYEGRKVQAFVKDKQTLDNLFDAVFSDKTDAEREAIKRRYATRSLVLNSTEPRQAKAIDLLGHYIDNILPNGFKAQLVASSREIAVAYVDDLRAARHALVTAIEAVPPEFLALNEEEIAKLEPATAILVRAHPRLDSIRRLEFAAVISAEHNEFPHLKAWSGKEETERRIERFKKPLSDDPLAILVVKSKLLTGFDAPVEQAMYLDRAMQGAELLQAIARTNRTAVNKAYGIVVDYHGVGRRLEAALSVYGGDDLPDITGGIGDPAELVPELRQQLAAIERLFADAGVPRGTSLQAYALSCVDKLRDKKLRAAFIAGLRTSLLLYDTLMPRPEARPFTPDVKLYAFIAKAAANLYRDPMLDIRGVAHKVRQMLDDYIRAQGIDPLIPPIGILDDRFAAVVAEKATDRSKAAEMENALRFHIEDRYDQDPARYKKLSDRLEDILNAHAEDWRQIVKELQDLIEKVHAQDAGQDTPHGLDRRTQAPIFHLLSDECVAGTDEARLVEMTVEIADHIRTQAQVPNFWESGPSREATRRWIVQRLDDTGLVDFDDLDRVSVAIIAVAANNRAGFAS